MSSESGTTSGAVMYWIRSERDSMSPADFTWMLQTYGAAFDEIGVELRWVSVDDIVIGVSGNGPAVSVAGERIDPATAFFHTMLMSSPHNRVDAWRHLTTYAALESAGFFVTVPPLHSLVNDDKVLTSVRSFKGAGRTVPTIRVNTRGFGTAGRAVDPELLAESGIGFPVVVKPVDWDGGNSVMLAADPDELHAALSIAGAADLTMVVQPYLGTEVVDFRVFCLDGEPYKVETRRPRAGGVAGNVAQGGSWGLSDVPEQLAGPARTVAATLGLPYLSVDFLMAGEEWWLSESELDAGSSGVFYATLRFGSYRKRFEDFVRTGSDRRTWRFVEPGREEAAR